MKTIRMKTLVASMAIMLATSALAAPSITGVTAQQRYPWNGKVDIAYTVSGDIAAAAKEQALIASLKVTATDRDAGRIYTTLSLAGDTGLGNGTHKCVWDMSEHGLSFKSTNVVFSVSCETTPATYCVIDLSAGSSASSYPITYLAEPPSGGFNTEEYKTTKLVLKRIEVGTFIMGEDQSDESHRVTLTKPFYMGLFEMTQKHYELVTGSNPSNFSGDKLPVEKVSYNAIRGSSNGSLWPASNSVDSSSFLGKLRARTGLDFDLPTEAQWEYACRAGTTTTYSYGNSVDGSYMWHRDNSSSKTHEVGTKQPNPWGLYDMHGNVWEFCLDWYNSTLSYGPDPRGSSSGSSRVPRGGSWDWSASSSTSSYRKSNLPSTAYYDLGFRLARTLTTNVHAATLCSGVSSPTIIDLSSGPRTAALAETIRYSTAWETSAVGATAVVSVNGETLSSATGSGAIIWQPTHNGTYTLTHKVLDGGGTQVGATLTATFAVSHSPEAPVISPEGGVVASWPQTVTISCATEGATIHYTTDGSTPTADSPTYRRFRLSEPTTVKAIAVKDGLVSEVAVAEYAMGRCADPVVTAASTFTGTKTQVALSCATEGAVVRYTLDGSAPNAGSAVYSAPFDVTESCTVKAYATYPDYFDSAVVSFAIEKVWGIGDTMGDSDRVFATGGDAPFFRVDDATAPLGEAMQAGPITHNQTSTMTTTVSGPGTISFQWRTSCEDSGGVYDWDHAEFEVDGAVAAKLDGETAWQMVSQAIAGNGVHTLVWRYVKDDAASEGDDCCRVANFLWTALAATQTTPEPVPYAWLRECFPAIADESAAYESAALATAANGANKVWECYVAGLSPTNAAARFEARIEFDADGNSVVKWSPDLNKNGTKHERVYTVEGKETLSDGWGPTNANSRFFRVKVSLPE